MSCAGAELYLEARRGIAGDMLLAALIDLGAPEEQILTPLREALPPFGWSLTRPIRRGIHCAKLDVEAVEKEPPHRHLPEIEALLAHPALPAPVQERARAAFRRLAQAEAKVHGRGIETVHFHEVGAIDSLVDIVGSILALHLLAPSRVICSSLPLGSGTVVAAHGTYPIPAPATLELLVGLPTHPYEVDREVTTPTGAALAAVLADDWGEPPPGRILGIGQGAGTREAAPNEPPNILRVWAVEPEEATGEPGEIAILETNIDHVAGEDAGHLVETLLEAGAYDVFLIPTIQKKSRPGLLVTVLCAPARADEFEDRLIVETGTLGVRRRATHRAALRREWISVEIQGHPVRVKCAWRGDRRVSARPEFEDLRALSRETGLPLRQLREEVTRELGPPPSGFHPGDPPERDPKDE